MHDEDSFLAAIRQTPADDVARLVFADWLDEQEDTACKLKAEFIRLELRMAEGRIGFEQALPHVQRYARIGFHPVPEHVVFRELALLGNLRGLRFQFLQTHDIRLVALDPFAKLCGTRTNSVDVPGSDFHL